MMSGTYTQRVSVAMTNALTGEVVTTNAIFVTINSHGAVLGQPVWLQFTTGGATSGNYQILVTTNGNTFVAFTADTVPYGGACIMPKYASSGPNNSPSGNSSGFVISQKTNVNYSTWLPHGLNPGDSVYINFTSSGSPNSGTFQVVSVPDPTHFTFVVPTINNNTLNSANVFPLIAPPIPRSGNVLVQWSTWNIGATDTGGTLSLAQTPLNSPTVFNFFFPDYKFPGVLSTAGMTTPEFQLTSDTTVSGRWLSTGMDPGNNNNTNGISGFATGAVRLTSAAADQLANVQRRPSGLVDSLNSCLCGGQLSAAAKAYIVNFPTIAASPYIQMRTGCGPSFTSLSPRRYTVQRDPLTH
jgi:hypothetical protein